MKSREFLIEYNRDVTLRHFGDKMFKQFMSAVAARLAWRNLNPQVQEMLTNQIIDTLEEHDPTPNKQYVPWMAREYANGNIQRLEDVPARVQPALEKFHRVKITKAFAEYLKTEPWVLETFKGPMSKAKDINTIKWWMLEDLMRAYEPEAEVKNKGESIEAFENEYVRVIVPLDQQAACYYGQGTKWCTAATKGTNLFKHYSKQGFLYIIIPKQKLKRPGEKYQLHPQSQQFMDETDTEVPLEKLDDFPGLQEYFKKKEWAKGLIEFEDPRLIKKLHDTVMNLIEEKARDEMSAIADEDYTYQDMLWQYAKDEENNQIDWYAVENDPSLKYENFVPKYAEIFSKIDDMKSWDAEQIKKGLQSFDMGEWTHWDGYGSFYNKVLRECARYSTQLIITPSDMFPKWADEISVVGPYTIGTQK